MVGFKPKLSIPDDALSRIKETFNDNDDAIKEAFMAGINSYEYANLTGVPYDDCFDQWVDHVKDLNNTDGIK